MQRMLLSANWQFKERDPTRDLSDEWASVDGWLPARVPGTVHEALLDAGLIPDPFYGLNEHAVQWVGEQNWLYRCAFEVAPAFVADGPIALCCDGLDTVATVWLNGKQVLAGDNMFVPARVPVRGLLQPGGNVLTILFASALRVGKEREAQWGRRAVWNGDPSRVYVRKAQYHYGWDWGPCLLTAGPWRAVRLEAGAARIAAVHCPVKVTSELDRADIPVHLAIEVDHSGADHRGAAYGVDVRLINPHGTVVAWAQLPVPENGEVRHSFYEIAESLNAYDADLTGDFTTTRFPARAIYERLLPAVCERLDPTRPYWAGSPYGGKPAGDQTIGDRHTWDIWHRARAPYQDYPRYAGRFVSEFGLQPCPALTTLASCVPPEERYPQSRTMEHHNKASEGPRRLAVYLNDTLRVRDTIEDYIYVTQFVQSEALVAAYRGWRRRWGGPGHYRVGGALVWQLNDCWPVTSWAILDYARRPKPAYYAVRRKLAPLVVGVAQGAGGVEVWAVNATLHLIEATLQVQGYELDGEQVFVHMRSAVLAPNQATELGTYALERNRPVVVGARLLADGEVVARATLWPEPFKYLTLSDPAITIERYADDRLQVQAARPAKGVWLTAGDDVAWSDNMLDLLPGDPHIIRAPGLDEHEISMQWLRSS